jgi:uncharacterized membrane protein YhiD involved in acid resistance
VWTATGLGIVVGQGEYVLALVASVLVLVMLAVVDRFTRGIAPVIYRRLIVRGSARSSRALAKQDRRATRGRTDPDPGLSGHARRRREPFELVFHVRCRNVKTGARDARARRRQEGVTSVEWSEISH